MHTLYIITRFFFHFSKFSCKELGFWKCWINVTWQIKIFIFSNYHFENNMNGLKMLLLTIEKKNFSTRHEIKNNAQYGVRVHSMPHAHRLAFVQNRIREKKTRQRSLLLMYHHSWMERLLKKVTLLFTKLVFPRMSSKYYSTT